MEAMPPPSSSAASTSQIQPPPAAAVEEERLDHQRPARTYHFPAEIAALPGARTSGTGMREWDLLSRGLGTVRNSTSTDRVDLDLSFDFVSQGGSRQGESSMVHARSMDSALFSNCDSEPSSQGVGSLDSLSPARRRGMSDAMSTNSSSRKKPPKPLSFVKKQSSAVLKSHFSPDTALPPLSSADGTEGHLPITPLGATRRGQVTRMPSSSSLRRERSNSLVGSQPPSDPPSTPLPPLPTSAASVSSNLSLVQQQRALRAQQQLQKRQERDSYEPLVPTIEAKDFASGPSKTTVPTSAKTPLDQTFEAQQPSAPKKIRNKPAHSEKLSKLSRLLSKPSMGRLAPPTSASSSSSSNALGWETGLISPTPPGINDNRTPRSMVKSPNVDGTELPSFGSQSFGLSTFSNQVLQPLHQLQSPSSSSGVPELTDSGSSPETNGMSTPLTATSSIFEGRLSMPSSEFTKGPSIESMQSIRPGKSKLKTSRDSITPWLPVSSVPNVIREEPLEENREASMGMPRSETAEWIRQQQKELQQSRERQETAQSYDSSSSAAPSVHPLVVSTSSSVDADPTNLGNDTELTIGRGPWPQSPLLLDDGQSKGVSNPETGIGLGLFLDQMEGQTSAAADQTVTVARHEVDMPRVSLPERAVHARTSVLASETSIERDSLQESPSLASSTDGFSMNVTLPSKAETSTTRKDQPSLTSRLNSRLFQHGSHAKQASEEALRSPPMRSLTLVDRQDTEDLRRQSLRRHSLAASGAAFAASLNGNESGHLQAPLAADSMAPNSAPLPSLPAFPLSTAVPTTFERSRRSSKHVRRVSRLHYIADESSGGLQLSIPADDAQAQGHGLQQNRQRFSVIGVGAGSAASDEADRLAVLAGIKSPRPAPSPSGNTPDMIYGHPRSRSSWGYAPRTASTGTVKVLETPVVSEQEVAQSEAIPGTPSSPWLDFHEDGRGLRQTRERFEALQDSGRADSAHDGSVQGTNSSAAHDSATGAASSGGYGESDADAGLRRRSTLDRNGHRSSKSVAPTATIKPFSWREGRTTSRGDKRSSVHLDILTGENGAKLGEVFEEKKPLRKLKLQGDLDSGEPEPTEESGMSVFVPLTSLRAHLRQRNLEQRQQRLNSMLEQPPVTTMSPVIETSPDNMTLQAEMQTQAAPAAPVSAVPQVKIRNEPKPMVAAGPNLLYSTGRLMDTELTSRTLFFAGFLGMPWLWLIGGWWLANDGLMMTPGVQQVQFWTHEASMRDAEEADRQRYAGSDEKPSSFRQSTTSKRQTLPSAPMDRLSTIYSVDEAHTGREEQQPEMMSTVYESQNSVAISSHASKSLHTAASELGLSEPRAAPRLSLSSSWSGSNGSNTPRTLLAMSSDKIPRKMRQSVGSLLNPQPAVALFHSPVRTVGSPKTLPASSSALSADDSGVEIYGSDYTDSDRQTDMGNDLHMSASRQVERESVSPQIALTMPSYHGITQQQRTDSAWERLAATEKFVLMNRFMAVVSTIAAFAGAGIALNAVAMNF
ncbi:unnamed protein product [Sympodiomycopsis kandeliae]